MGLLYGRAGRLTAENAGFRPGQAAEACELAPLQASRGGGSAIEYGSPLSVRKDAYGHSWYCARSDEYWHVMTDPPRAAAGLAAAGGGDRLPRRGARRGNIRLPPQ
jgi:hypothetical protein